MSRNKGITDRGLLTLGESLKKNKGLKTLGLNGFEHVTTRGRKLFVLCLKENHYLTSLGTSNSPAVQQEVVAVNETRKQQGLPLLKVT